jgi:hypothetical protein
VQASGKSSPPAWETFRRQAKDQERGEAKRSDTIIDLKSQVPERKAEVDSLASLRAQISSLSGKVEEMRSGMQSIIEQEVDRVVEARMASRSGNSSEARLDSLEGTTEETLKKHYEHLAHTENTIDYLKKALADCAKSEHHNRLFWRLGNLEKFFNESDDHHKKHLVENRSWLESRLQFIECMLSDRTKAEHHSDLEGRVEVLEQRHIDADERLMQVGALLQPGSRRSSSLLNLLQNQTPGSSRATSVIVPTPTVGGSTQGDKSPFPGAEPVESNGAQSPVASGGKAVAEEADSPQMNSKPSSASSFRGKWPGKGSIKDGKLKWDYSGLLVDVSFIDEDTLTIEMNGKVLKGSLHPNGDLAWDDGDIWNTKANLIWT